MATTIERVIPFAIRKVAVSAGGAGQVTVINFPEAQANEVITIIAETEMFLLQEGSPAEGAAYNDDLAFLIPINGYATFPVAGWADRPARILLASATSGAIARVMVAKQA